MLRYVKNIILTFILINLLASNLLLLLYQPYSQTLSNILNTAFGINSVTSLLTDAIALKNTKIRFDQQKTNAMYNQIANLKSENQNLTRKHHQQSQFIRHHSRRIYKRTRKLITRTLATIPTESIPVIGTGVVIAGTVYEIHTACLNLSDIVQMQREVGVSDTQEKHIIDSLCSAIDI